MRCEKHGEIDNLTLNFTSPFIPGAENYCLVCIRDFLYKNVKPVNEDSAVYVKKNKSQDFRKFSRYDIATLNQKKEVFDVS